MSYRVTLANRLWQLKMKTINFPAACSTNVRIHSVHSLRLGTDTRSRWKRWIDLSLIVWSCLCSSLLVRKSPARAIRLQLSTTGNCISLYTIYYILYTIYYILYAIYYILYTIYYILYYTHHLLLMFAKTWSPGPSAAARMERHQTSRVSISHWFLSVCIYVFYLCICKGVLVYLY